jgi:Copper transport outer membrane protein, MctB
MFDLRYHVASLAAVFLALVIGILVGVALASHGLGDAERKTLQRDVGRLQDQNDLLKSQLADQSTDAAFVDKTYGAIMDGRLKGKRIAVLFIGSVDSTTGKAIGAMLDDAGGSLLRLRAIAVPLDRRAIENALAKRPQLASFATGDDHMGKIGRELADEFVVGIDTPLWNALEQQLVAERSGSGKKTADGVIVVRTAGPQRAGTAKFLRGLLSEFGDLQQPVVGVEQTRTRPSAVGLYKRLGLASVDDIDLKAGRVAVAVLLSSPDSGGGHYGVQPGEDALPDVTPVPPPTTTTGG